MDNIRKWSVRPRGNGTLNIIETDLVGIDRVLFNLRHGVSENDAQAISVARESLALLKEIAAFDTSRFDGEADAYWYLVELSEKAREIISRI